MAEFNPEVPTVGTPDYTRASQGAGPNRAFEALFSGVGDAISMGAATADTYVQNKIEDDARYGFESLNQEMNLDVETAPPELTQSAEGLERLTNAWNQGKVSQEYYYGRLASTLKGLRSRYPGYEKQVDDIVQKVTGTRPANAYRDALFSAAQSVEASQRDSASKFDNFVRQNLGYINMVAPDFFTNPDKYAGREQELIGDVARVQGQEQTFKFQTAANANNKQGAQMALNTRLNEIAGNGLMGASNSLGQGTQDFYRKLNEFSKTGLNEQQSGELYNQFVQFQNNVNTQMMQAINDPVFMSQFSPSERQQQIEAAMAPIRQIGELIQSKQYSEAARISGKITAMQDKAKAAIYAADPNTLVLDAFGKVSPGVAEILATDLVSSAGGTINYIDKSGISQAVANIVAGDDTIGSFVNRAINSPGISAKDKSEMVKTGIDQVTSVIRSGKATPEELTRLVSQNYNQDIDQLFTNLSTSTDKAGNSQYLRLYNQMFNPEITKQIVASGNPQALKQYTDAAVDKFQAIPEFRTAAADLQENLDYSKYARVRYDEKSNRLVLEADQDAINNLGYFQKDSQKMKLLNMIKAKDSLNKALSIMSPIIEANGGDEAAAVSDLTRNMAMNLQGGHREGFFWWLNSALDRTTQRIAAGEPGTGETASTKAEDTEASDFKEVGENTTRTLIDEDPILWDVQNGGSLAEQGDLIGEVMGSAQTNYAPEGRGNAGSRAIDQLMPSSARGRAPDLENLDAGFRDSLGTLQSAFGTELPIVSGYRDPERNRKAGGASKSRHMHGDAVDIDVRNLSREDRIRLIQLARQQGFGGVGVYENSIHLDKGRKRSWGPSYRNSSLPKWARDALEG